MHRNRFWIASIRLIAVIALILVVVQGSAIGRVATMDATPQPETQPDGNVSYDYEVDGLGTAWITPQAGEAATASPVAELEQQQVALTRVTLEPGEGVENVRAHQGSSVLYVVSGTICYEIHDPHGATIELIVPEDLWDNEEPSAVPASAEETCTLPPDDCISTASGCDLVALGLTSVVVHEGQSVRQTIAPLAFTERGYRNIGEGNAVIWIAQVQTAPGNGAPCGGGCP